MGKPEAVRWHNDELIRLIESRDRSVRFLDSSSLNASAGPPVLVRMTTVSEAGEKPAAQAW